MRVVKRRQPQTKLRDGDTAFKYKDTSASERPEEKQKRLNNNNNHAPSGVTFEYYAQRLKKKKAILGLLLESLKLAWFWFCLPFICCC